MWNLRGGGLEGGGESRGVGKLQGNKISLMVKNIEETYKVYTSPFSCNLIVHYMQIC